MLTRLAVLLVATTAACSNDVDSDEQARRAYLGLDPSIGKALQLGFDGFNAASSANIPAQMMAGDTAGTLTIAGQVDHGASDNKGMRLSVGMVAYTDGPFVVDDHGDTLDITYDTDADTALQPALTLTLRNVPDGTLDGTLVGTYHLGNDLDGDVTLDLTFTGEIEAAPNDTVVRTPGTTTVTGTARQGDGSYAVSVEL